MSSFSQELVNKHLDKFHENVAALTTHWGTIKGVSNRELSAAILQDLMKRAEREISLDAAFSYHHVGHCVDVAVNVSRIARKLGMNSLYHKAVTVAALWHDADYQGAKNDNDNVLAAIQAFLGFCEENGEIEDLQEIRDLVCALIYSSSENHNLERNLFETILKDADLMPSLSADFDLWTESYEREIGNVPVPGLTKRKQTAKLALENRIKLSVSRKVIKEVCLKV